MEQDQKSGIYSLIELSREIQPMEEEANWDISDVIVKLMEETGEFAEAVQITRGKINKNQEKFAEFYEAADVIICIIDALSRLHPDMSTTNIHTFLNYCFRKKGKIWLEKMKEEIQE